MAYLEAAVADAVAGKLDALVTAPINKASCRAAGFAFPGHTEFLQARFGAGAVTMMFAGPRMRVSLATIHHALADVPRVLSAEAIATAIVQTAEAPTRDFGVAAPRIAVAGLNPHAGRAGPLRRRRDPRHRAGDRGRRRAPVGRRHRRRAVGPRVPDAVFREHLDGRFDAVVAMYHDQGLIPVKVVDFEEAVNLTLGCPIVRTSPDHGVAYDIAGKKRARPTSFAAALRLASRARRRAGITSAASLV